MNGIDPLDAMSGYERKRWKSLDTHWRKKAQRRQVIPPRVRAALGSAGGTSRATARAAGRKVVDLTPDAVKDVGEWTQAAVGAAARKVVELTPDAAKDVPGFVVDGVFEPTVKAVVALVDLAADWVIELNDPATVLEFHRARGRNVQELADLSSLDLADLDEFSRHSSRRWGTFGAAEGAAMGALGFIPVVGTLASIPADALILHLLSTGIAVRSAYTYGLDAQGDDQRHHLDRMVKNSYAEQAAKAGVVHKAAQAFEAGKGRVKWSEKLRNDHRILEALERLMKSASGKEAVPVEKVVSKLPVIGIITSAGMNAHTLGSVASNSRAYAQTLFLAGKHGLPLPGWLLADDHKPTADDGD